MRDRRKHVRVEWQSAGIVIGPDGVRHACTVSNLSDGGAKISQLDVNAAELPDDLRLRLANERGPGWVCRVVWRNVYEAGLQFTAPASRAGHSVQGSTRTNMTAELSA